MTDRQIDVLVRQFVRAVAIGDHVAQVYLQQRLFRVLGTERPA